VRKVLLLACVLFAFTGSKALARDPITFHMDDGGQWTYQVGERCTVAGAITTGYDPGTSATVTLICVCSPGIGDVCLWSRLNYRKVQGYRQPVVEDGGGGIGTCYPGQFKIVYTPIGYWVCHGTAFQPETWGWEFFPY
jgi:hypothetical protein